MTVPATVCDLVSWGEGVTVPATVCDSVRVMTEVPETRALREAVCPGEVVTV